MRAFVLAACGWLLMCSTALRAEAPRVTIVLTAADAYKEAANAIKERLTRQGCKCTLIQLPTQHAAAADDDEEPTGPATATAPAETNELPPAVRDAVQRLRASRPQAMVTVGGSATSLARQAGPNVPIVFCMVPNALDRSFMEPPAGQGPRLLGVTTDIAPELQVEQIQRLSPKAAHVAVFHGPRSRRTAEAIKAAAEKKGLRVTPIPARAAEFASALRELDRHDCDAALMIADAEVYNSASVQALLLWGLRGRRPVWTFSPNVVKAGGFAGLYADSAGLAEQAATLVEKLLRNTDVGPARLRYPETVRGSINERTAELIGIGLDRRLENSVAVRFDKQ